MTSFPTENHRRAQYARQEMVRHAVGPRRTGSLRTYVLATRIIGGLSVVVLFGAIAWDLASMAENLQT